MAAHRMGGRSNKQLLWEVGEDQVMLIPSWKGFEYRTTFVFWRYQCGHSVTPGWGLVARGGGR